MIDACKNTGLALKTIENVFLFYFFQDDLTSSGKLHQHFGQSSREQQSLSGVRKPPDDLLKLLSKTHFKQPEWMRNMFKTHMHTSDSKRLE